MHRLVDYVHQIMNDQFHRTPESLAETTTGLNGRFRTRVGLRSQIDSLHCRGRGGTRSS
jgi:hypothetical protein